MDTIHKHPEVGTLGTYVEMRGKEIVTYETISPFQPELKSYYPNARRGPYTTPYNLIRITIKPQKDTKTELEGIVEELRKNNIDLGKVIKGSYESNYLTEKPFDHIKEEPYDNIELRISNWEGTTILTIQKKFLSDGVDLSVVDRIGSVLKGFYKLPR